MRLRRRARAAACLCASALAATSALEAQGDAPRSRMRETLTQSKLDAIRDRMLPLVEKHAGRRFRKKPLVVIAKPAQVAQRLAREAIEQFRFQYPRSPERELARQASAFAVSTAAGLLGKFDFASKQLYVTPRRFEQLVKAGALKAEDEDALLELVVAHELTHALQDESYSLSALGTRGAAVMNAWQVVIEGHASFVQNAIARELGLESAARAFDAIILGKKNAAARSFALRYQRMNAIAFYYMGARYFADLVAAHGKAAQWRPFEDPPRDARFVFDAELRAASLDAKGAAGRALPRQAEGDAGMLHEVASLFGKRVRALASTMGQESLRGLFMHADAAELSRVLRPIRRAHFLQCGRGGALAVTCALRFTDAASATRYVSAARSWIEAELRDAAGTDVAKPEALGRARAGVDFSSRKGKIGQVLGVFRWYRDGSDVVQIDATNFRLDAAELDAIASRVVEQMRR